MPLYKPADIILNEKYKIERLLGAGAFGEVYLTTHQDLGVYRAIKVAHRSMPGFASSRFEEAFDRFRQEAQIGARLKHDNLIQVFDFYDGEDSLHLVMEYAAGGSLEDKLQQKLAKGETFSVDETITILKDVASGLAVLHDKRNPIVHRDLKPSNILFDEEGKAKIADLGLAQVMGGLSQRSRLGSVALSHPGTPAYMSPEHENSFGMLRPASDVYSLGVIAFEMLTGVNYNMQPPGTKLTEIREIPYRVSNLIESMLAKVADQRIWDGKKIFDLLNNLENVSDVKSEPVRFKKWGFIVFGMLSVGIFAVLILSTQNQKPDVSITKETGPMVVAVTPAPTKNRQPTSEPTKDPKVVFTSTPTRKAEPTLGIGSSKISEKDGMEMVYVPAGSFMMGSNSGDLDERPMHEVFLEPYWIDKYEVTNAQYEKCMNAGACGLLRVTSLLEDPDFRNHPVVYVTWYEARDYCLWVARDLPTEAQWEKAAKGENGNTYPWGSDSPYCALAQFNGCDGETISYNGNASGQSAYYVFNMAGNVWEWVSDWYDKNFYQSNLSANNPEGPQQSTSSKVLRGGSWDGGEDLLRTASRFSLTADSSYNDIGFRCVSLP